MFGLKIVRVKEKVVDRSRSDFLDSLVKRVIVYAVEEAQRGKWELMKELFLVDYREATQSVGSYFWGRDIHHNAFQDYITPGGLRDQIKEETLKDHPQAEQAKKYLDTAYTFWD